MAGPCPDIFNDNLLQSAVDQRMEERVVFQQDKEPKHTAKIKKKKKRERERERKNLEKLEKDIHNQLDPRRFVKLYFYL